MPKPNLSPPILITQPDELAQLVHRLSRQPIIAADTESNSLYAYQEQVCLIQLSIPGADFVVDPLADLDVGSLGPVFANPAIEKVFHAAEYDVICLRRDFGWTFANLFDTMWTARVLGWPRIGLSDILQEHFGVKLNKRWQRYNWGRRPLPTKALAYARLDTHFLISLRDQMVAELQEKGRLQEAREFFVDVAQAEPNFRDFDPDADLWRVKGVWDLEPEHWAVLRELIIWRDAQARRQDRPSFKVMGDQTLVAVAQTRPDHLKQLERIKGLKAHQVRRYGRYILSAVRRGNQARPPQPPPRPSPPPEDRLKRYEALRTWRKKVAARRGVDPDVIISNAALWKLARHVPRSPDQLAKLEVLGPWKRQTYGEALLDVLERHS